MKVGMNHRELKVKVTFYLDQNDLSQRSFIKDQISYKCSQDHLFSGLQIFSIITEIVASFKQFLREIYRKPRSQFLIANVKSRVPLAEGFRRRGSHL